MKLIATHAALHVINIAEIMKCDTEEPIDVPEKSTEILDRMRASYLNLKLIHGDMILDISNREFGYRSCGIWFYHGTSEKIVGQNRYWDEYGSPSNKFDLIKEFPPGYWSLKGIENLPMYLIDHCGYYESHDSKKVKFPYWHSEASYSPIHVSDFNTSVDYESVTGAAYRHHIVTSNGSRYIISVPKGSARDEYYVCAAAEIIYTSNNEPLEIAKNKKVPAKNVLIGI